VVHVTAWWKLGLALAAAIGLLAVMDEVPGVVAVAMLATGIAVLGIAGALWGQDSRDCGDWSPNGRARALRG
jgi:hypothetical protein